MRYALALLCLLALAACGSTTPGAGTPSSVAGAPFVLTRNTTRIAGAAATVDAAAVALASFPAGGAATVALADAGDWQAGLAAALLMSSPLHAPLLLSNGTEIPAATGAALKALHPSLVVRVGRSAQPAAIHSTQIVGADPATLAANVATYEATASNAVSASVEVVSQDAPRFAMPAAAWAAQSGDPVLFVTKSAVPAATRSAIERLAGPRIYVLGPASVIDQSAIHALSSLGSVTRISGPDPVSNAIAFARYSDANFGWGIVNPGHGLVFASTSDPAVAGAVSALSASGTFGPLLLLDSNTRLAPALGQFLLNIQPGYAQDPVRGVYNHGWLIGNSISAAVQAQIDALLEIEPVSSTTTNTTTTP